MSLEMTEEVDLQLQIPAQPEHVNTARMFVVAAAHHFSVDEETVEDIRVAVSEACTGAIHAITAADSSGMIGILVRSSADRLTFEVTAPVPGGFRWDPSTPAEEFQPALGRDLVHSLFEDTEWNDDAESGLKVRFSVPIVAG